MSTYLLWMVHEGGDEREEEGPLGLRHLHTVRYKLISNTHIN